MSQSIAPTKDFFINYTGQERTWAEWIAWVLEEAGYTVVIQALGDRANGSEVLQRLAELHYKTGGIEQARECCDR